MVIIHKFKNEALTTVEKIGCPTKHTGKQFDIFLANETPVIAAMAQIWETLHGMHTI